ncbi:hypothetical protein [Agromyces sp. NPDC049794]|uniref:hypothetical protein n=1 Tax=unclassified Agromyces TaxID=2639701 RepID=UPI0033C7CE5B
MGELAHGTMLVGALAGTACTMAGLRGRQALDLAAAAVMLAAMLDMGFIGFLPSLVWAMLLLVTGLALGARLRVLRGDAGRGIRDHRASRELHRALAFIVGAWAFAGSAVPGAAASAHHGTADGLAFGAAVVAMTVFGGWLAISHLRRGHGNRLHAAEAASTTVMLAAMALPALLPALG